MTKSVQGITYFMNIWWHRDISVPLTFWGPVEYICVSEIQYIIGSDKALSNRRQAIFGTKAGLLSIKTLVTYLGNILIEIQTFFIEANEYQHFVCEIATVLSQFQYVLYHIKSAMPITNKDNHTPKQWIAWIIVLGNFALLFSMISLSKSFEFGKLNILDVLDSAIS